MVPRLVDRACGARSIARQRQKIVPRAHGRVLELGMGSGFNLPFYDPERVVVVVGVEPAALAVARAREEAAGLGFEVEILEQGALDLPLGDASIDTVVVTYTLCTIPDVAAALDEVRRVLVPGGELLFSEHGLAPDAGPARWQHRIQPLWGLMSGGCHLTRDPVALLRAAGFELDDPEAMYLPGLKLMNWHTWGAARR